MTSTLTPEQQRLNDLWEEHLRDEFVTRDTEATLDTMVPDAYVNHVPVSSSSASRTPWRWSGCSRAWRRRASEWKSPSW